MKKDMRNQILDAAERVLSRQGLANTTLDAVALEARMSKGGILHYYANKRELLSAAIFRFEEYYFARRDEIYESLPDTPARLAKATIMAITASRERAGSSTHYRIDMLEDKNFRELVGNMKARLFNDIFKGAQSPGKMLNVLYMLDGLWMHHFFTPSPVPASMASRSRKWLFKHLEALFDNYTGGTT